MNPDPSSGVLSCAVKPGDSLGRMDGRRETPAHRRALLPRRNPSKDQYLGRDTRFAQGYSLLDERNREDLGTGRNQCSGNRLGSMSVGIGLDNGNQAIEDCGLEIANWVVSCQLSRFFNPQSAIRNPQSLRLLPKVGKLGKLLDECQLEFTGRAVALLAHD